jgi:hypothetical protein
MIINSILITIKELGLVVLQANGPMRAGNEAGIAWRYARQKRIRQLVLFKDDPHGYDV